MVVFACGACGESLKKNQVETHYYRKCRNCNVLSCLDCGKDFWGNEYEAHTKCISEEEKYSGKNFVPKPGANKNEIKQQQWIHQVQEAVDKCKTNPRLQGILVKLKDHANIPRKKNKFLEETSNKPEAETEDVKQTQNSSNVSEAESHDTDTVKNGVEENIGKMSKRDKKEARRKKMHKAEKKDKVSVSDVCDSNENGVIEKKSKKKKKQKDFEEESPESNKKSRKRKRDKDECNDDVENVYGSAIVNDDDGNGDDDNDENHSAKKKFKTKFNWNEVIVEVLQSKGPELKIKKLKKKVLSEYLAQGCTEKSEEKLWAKFDKKLKKIPEVKVIGDKVKLKNAS
ncbi:hypothetical protein ACF0H5_009205 [Mactra antiquata]